MTRRLYLVLAVGGLVLLASSSFVCHRVAERGRFASAYSSYGSGPEGTRGLYLLAESMGAGARRWAEDLARLPPGALLVALGGCAPAMARPVSRQESEELRRWIEAGGVLLVAGVREYLPEALGVSFAPEPGCGDDGEEPAWIFQPENDAADASASDASASDAGASDASADDASARDAHASGDGGVACQPTGVEGEDEETDAAGGALVPITWALPASDVLRGLQELPLERAGRIVVPEGTVHDVLLAHADTAGRTEPLAVAVKYGKGTVIALASASLFQNHSLAEDQGGVLFARLLQAYAPSRQVVFDEYHLGIGERRSLMRYLRQVGATPFILQLALVVLIALWRGGARFGGLRAPLPERAAGTASLVASLGDLFERTHDPIGAIRALVKQALARIAAHHHVAPASARRLALALEQRGQRAAAERVRRIGRPEASLLAEAGSLAACSRALDAWVAEACAEPELE